MKNFGVIGIALGMLAGCASDEQVSVPPAPLVGSHYGLAVAEGLPDGDLLRVADLTKESLFALPDGARRDWNNPEAGSSGSVTVLSSSIRENGTKCRLFAQQFYFEGKIEKALGEACLNDKNDWILQSKSPG